MLQSKTFLTSFFLQVLKKTHPTLNFLSTFFALPRTLFLPVFIEKRRFLKPKMSSSIPIAVRLWFKWPGAIMLVEIRDSPIQESCLWQQLILKRKEGQKKQKEKRTKISRIRSVLLTSFTIPCHEAWAYILLQTGFIFLCYIICITAVYLLLSYDYILKENSTEFFRLTLRATFLTMRWLQS